MIRTHAELALLAVNTTGRDLIHVSTYGQISDMGARLVAGALADHFQAEATGWARLWPEAERRAEDAADELAAVAVYEDADTADTHRNETAAYEARGDYRYASRG